MNLATSSWSLVEQKQSRTCRRRRVRESQSRTAALPMRSRRCCSRTPKVHHGSWRGREKRAKRLAEARLVDTCQHHANAYARVRQELDEQLRPHAAYPQRHAAGDGVQARACVRRGWRSGGTFASLRGHLRGGARSRSRASAAAATARPTHAANMPAPRMPNRGRARTARPACPRQRPRCSPRRGGLSQGPRLRSLGAAPEQRGQRAFHEERRCLDEHEGKNPGERLTASRNWANGAADRKARGW